MYLCWTGTFGLLNQPVYSVCIFFLLAVTFSRLKYFSRAKIWPMLHITSRCSLLFTWSLLDWVFLPAELLMTTCKTRSHNTPTDAPIEHHILRKKKLHKRTKNRRQQHFKGKSKISVENVAEVYKGRNAIPITPFYLKMQWGSCEWTSELSSENLYTRGWVCKGQQMNSNCGHGFFDIMG